MTKRLSIKTRVTLWYTLLVLLLVGIGLAYIFTLSNRIQLEKSRELLTSTVSELIPDIELSRNGVEEDALDFYVAGVSLFLYDEQGRLLAPAGSRGIKVNALLEDDYVKTVEATDGTSCFVYDLYTSVSDQGIWIRGVLPIAEVTSTIRLMLFTALVMAPVFLVITAAGGFIITRKAFRPVQSIIDTANAISGGGDLSLRIEVEQNSSRDEVARLGLTFNSMFDRLQASFESEKQFTSDASHELRTPIAIILSQCEYGLEQAKTEQEHKEVLESVLRQAKKMSALVSQLLTLARADNGKFQLEIETVNFSELCEIVCEELSLKAEERGISLYPDLEKDLIIEGDQTFLLRMLTNLINNAVCYNRRGGEVRVRLRRQEACCLLEVEDNGIGIAPEHLDKIWNRFYQADPSRSARESGSGLGLPMVKWIVQAHAGSISVTSTPGQGSRFSVLLPLNGAMKMEK
ncbi:sensor histidine kinase [Anaerolentibacter hominis]|uniref:sensor histidine kinase n=1 Tax=Anaerolentibacter hominis TaxID=3079009 RepID=UPI0031B86E6F